MILLTAGHVLAGLAHAGLHADLDRELADAPELAVVCTSASEALIRVQQAAMIFGGGGSGGSGERGGAGELVVATPGDALLPFLDGMRAILQERGAPDARLAIGWWQASETLQLGFDTTLTAQALAARFVALDPAAGGVVFEGPTGWGIREADGEEMTVAVQDGWARVVHGPTPAASTPERAPRALAPGLLTSIPETPGCVVAAHVEDDGLGEVDIVAHLSFTEGKPATFAVSMPGLQSSTAILFEGAVPPVVTTPERPQAVVVVGVGLDSVDFSAFLTGQELRYARRLQNLFPVTGGTTVALLALEPVPRIAAVIPFSGHMPARKVARRARRLAKLADLEVRRIDATTLTFGVGELEILASASANRLDLSTDAGTLNAMAAGRSGSDAYGSTGERGGDARLGEPWVTGPVAELAAEWPLVVTSSILPGGDGLPTRVLPRPLYLALDLEDALLKGVIDVPLPLAEMAALAEQLDQARKTKGASSMPPETTE